MTAKQLRYLNFFSKVFFLIFCASIKGNAQEKSLISLKGLVHDDKQLPIDGVSVSLLNGTNHQLIAQTLTDKKGQFSFEHSGGTVEIALTSVGFIMYRSKVISWTNDLVLEPVLLIADQQKLKEVTIKGQNTVPLVRAQDGKIIFNVAASINAQGSNAFETLKRAPGITVSNDNSISIAGRQGSLVMLNGKQTYMQTAELADLLKSMPSSNIKSIEVIGNPTAQYDAAGSGGIINIVLKKNDTEGLNATLNTGLSYGFTLKQNTELSFNYRKDKLNIFGTYNHAFGNFGLRYGMDRIQSDKVFNGFSHDTDKRKKIGSAIGADYRIDDRQTVGITMNGNFLFGGGFISTLTDIKNGQTGALESTLLSESDYYHQQANRYSTGLNYQYEDTAGRKLNLDLDYALFNAANGNFQPNTYFNPDGSLASVSANRTLGDRDIDLYAFAASYQTNLWKGKLNTGFKLSSVDAGNGFNFYDASSSPEIIDPDNSNLFNFKERIAGIYFQYDHPLSEQLSFQAGMRMEQTNATGTLSYIQNSTLPDNRIERDYLNAFPSAGLNYQIREGNNLSLNYGRRIDRPAYQDLNPIEQPLDGLSYWKGNPYLLPQTTQRISAQYAFKKTIVDLSYAFTKNYRAQVSDTVAGNKVIMEPRNLGTQEQLALNVVQQINPFKVWSISLSATGFYKRNKVMINNSGDFDVDRFAATINLQQTFSLPFKIKAEVAAAYNSNRLGWSNDISRRNSQVDLGFQRNILKDKAKLLLSFTDIYLGNKWDATNIYQGYSIRSYGYMETRQVKLNFSYNFGNIKVKGPKAKESGLKSETERL